MNISPENSSMLRTAIMRCVIDRSTCVMSEEKVDGVTVREKRVEIVMDETQRAQLAESLIKFVEAASLKFVRGQIEHGGQLSKRNLKEERANEIYDLWFYNDYDTSSIR